MKRTIDNIDVRGKRVLVRLDLDVPLDDHQRITDDRRIAAGLPTLKHLLDAGARVIILSHLGRPGSTPEDRRRFSFAPVARRLAERLERSVPLVEDFRGDAGRKLLDALPEGGVCLLENLRFHEEETIKDKKAAADPDLRARKDAFAAALAAHGDVYVNDAFGTSHRDNASMVTVPANMAGRPRVTGFRLQRELEVLGAILKNPARPFVCLLGGAKVSDKLGVIRSLLALCDAVLIGGAMAYTFLSADGLPVGQSRVEPDLFDTARDLRRTAGNKLRLPVDSLAAQRIDPDAETSVCDGPIPEGWMGLDIGPKTIQAYSDLLSTAGLIFWNGPMGVFETPPFDTGTVAMAKALAAATDRGATTVVGGGDSAAAVDAAGVIDRITHISTGGGAALEFLEGKRLPALEVLDDA